MADIVFNQALGQVNKIAADGGDVRVLLMQSIGNDVTLKDLDNLAAVIATGSEANFTGYSRKTVANLANTVDDGTDIQKSAFDDVVWDPAGGTTDNTIISVIVFLQVTNDNDSIPLTKHDVSFTTNGSSVTIQNPAGGFFAAI